MADLTVLDVGHGNCAVLHDERGTVIVDAGQGDTLLEFLEHRGITEIDAILVSHADADHIGGVLALLSQRDIAVRSVFLNTETLRRTALWQAFRVALADARTRQTTSVRIELTTESTAQLDRGDVRLEILAPTPEVAASGASGQDLSGRSLTANAMSAVVRVVCNELPEVLLPGDLDVIGLENLLAEHPEPRARVLVFPHHGGRAGRGDTFAFAWRLCRAVQPDVVVFSIGRGKHGTPQPEVIQGVRAGAPAAHIACTQLSERCAAVLPAHPPGHVGDRPARGRAANACCVGTLEVLLGSTDTVCTPALIAHRAFVEREAQSALCLGRGLLATRPRPGSAELL